MNTPSHFDAARAAFAARDFQRALALAQAGLRIQPDHEGLLVLLVNAATQLGNPAGAMPALDRLLRLRPGHPQYPRVASQTLNRLGCDHRREGRVREAQQAFERALQLWPDNAEALYNQAALLTLHRALEPALPLWQRLHALRPGDVDVALSLCDVLGRLGYADEAAQVFDAIPAPSTSEAADPAHLLRRAEAASVAGRTAQAAALVATVTPEAAHGFRLLALGERLAAAADVEAASVAYDKAAQAFDGGRVSPGLRGTISAALALPSVYEDAADLQRHRDRFADALERLALSIAPERLHGVERRLEQLAWSNFFLAYQGEYDRELQQRYGEWLARTAPLFAPEVTPANAGAPAPVADASLRIAMVGSVFRRCTAGSYFGRWIDLLASLGHEVQVFQLGPGFDDFTDELARSAHALHRIDRDLNALAAQLRNSDFDLILYPELGMDHRMLPLAALRLARRQACAWGHPVTTGLPTIDGYFTCAEMEPDDAAAHYSERLLPLPGLGTDYARPALPPPASRGQLGLPEDRRLYLLPHALIKLHPDSDAVFAQVAAQDPGGTLVLFRGEGGGAFAPYRRRLARALVHAGADPDAQLLFLPMMSRERFLQVNRACDVMVDSIHWSGGNTALDALICGVPVVTTPGRFMRGRQSAAMLRRMGLPELVVDTPDAIAALAVRIAGDPGLRTQLSQRIEAALPTLFDTTGLAQALDARIRELLHG
jgi:predicted O-linked N-acetylglucosamine transferase (SPINDLY family)